MRRHLAPLAPAGLLPAVQAPTFSIVIAAYQAADTIGAAIESALAQTLPPADVVVCDDGSTDGLDAELAPFGDRIRVIRQDNAGEGAAKNAAARAATGEFVAILDADDAYLPERLAALSELATARPDLDILTTDARLEANGSLVRLCYTRDWTFPTAGQREEILRRNFVFGHAAVRRQRLLDVGGFDELIRWTADWELWIRMILSGSAVGCVDEPLAVYRLHEGSLTAQRLSLARGRIQTLEKTARNPVLSNAEFTTVADARRRATLELTLLELRESLLGRVRFSRRRALAVALERAYSGRTRLKATAIFVAPGVASRIVRRRAERKWTGAGGVVVERD
jgi:GT2 family glycosyltransferase